MQKPRAMIVALSASSLWACSDASTTALPLASPATDVTSPARSFLEQDSAYDCGPGPLSPNVMFDPGQTGAQLLHRQGDRVLSKGDGRWILWDTASRRQIATGTFTPPKRTRQNQTPTYTDLAGSTIMVPVNGEVFELRDVRDGKLRARVTMNGRIRQSGLSVDGSYAYSLDRESLRVWSIDGTLRLQRPGDYYGAAVFADRDALYIAGGPTKTQTVETIRLDGRSTFSRRYLGSFNDWFTDGTHFLTNTRSDVHVYDRDGVLVQTVRVADPDDDAGDWYYAGGHGRFFWIDDEEMSLYALGSDTPIASVPSGSSPQASRGGTVGILTEDRSELVQIDLRGEQPRVTTTAVPADTEPTIYAAGPDGSWALGSTGAIYVSTANAAAPTLTTLGCGTVKHIAGAPSGTVAIATSDGRVHVHDRARRGAPYVSAIPLAAETLALSSDGYLLYALGSQWLGSIDRALRVVGLPSGAEIHTFPLTPEQTQRFSSSRDGRRLARLVCHAPDDGSPCSLSLSDPTGRPLADDVLIDAQLSERSPDLQLAPGGALVAVHRDADPPAFAIYDATGALVSTISARFLGFLDDERLLVNRGRRYETRAEEEVLVHRYEVVDRTGRTLAAHDQTAWYGKVQPLGTAYFYDVATNAIYRASDGTVAWAPPSEDEARTTLGVLAGPSLIYLSQGLVHDVPLPTSIR